MKKSNTQYYFNVFVSDDKTDSDTINIDVNEECSDNIKITYFQDRRRTKEEHIKLLESIIKELTIFTSNQYK